MSNLPRNGTRVVLLVALLLGCSACASRQPTPQPVKLKVVIAPFLDQAPVWVADQEGYFRAQGIELELTKMARSSEAIPALAAGQADVVQTVLTVSLLNAVRANAIKIVAGAYNVGKTGCAWQGIVVRKALLQSGELSTAAGFRGRIVSVNPVHFAGYYTDKLLSTVGLSLDDVQVSDLPDPSEFDALQTGAIDIATTAEPWITRIVQAGHAELWKSAQEVIPDFQVGIILFGPSLLTQNPDAGRRFVIAYLQAVRQLNQGKTERNIELVADFTELDKELLRQICWPVIPEDGYINVQSVLDFQDWALTKGYLETSVTEEQFWDGSYVEYANKVLQKW